MKKLILVFGMIACVLLTNVNVQAQNRISSQAKGAIIGGAGGALLGALVGHNAKGALIGAAIGAGGGYIIGNEHNRNVQKREAAYRTGYNSGYYTRNREVSRSRANYSNRVYNTRYHYYPKQKVRYARYY